jgi:hypothetical protein
MARHYLMRPFVGQGAGRRPNNKLNERLGVSAGVAAGFWSWS